MTDAMQPTRSRILERVRLVITEPSTHELDTADLVWLYSIALAAVDASGENAGLTQASDSLARISSAARDALKTSEGVPYVFPWKWQRDAIVSDNGFIPLYIYAAANCSRAGDEYACRDVKAKAFLKCSDAVRDYIVQACNAFSAPSALARISSSHPEDGGIREALEKAEVALCAAEIVIDADDCVETFGLIQGTRQLVQAALNSAPLPIGEEK